ncbi:MAG: NAD(P)-dependent oxidoreductase [Patescibacteria group bacterium]
MKKILILGSNGNLGGQLFDNIVGLSDFQVIPYDRTDLNLLEQDSIVSKISKVKPDLIINATAYNAVDKCEEFDDEFKLAKKINADALKYIGKAAIKNNAVLVHYSSDYVFGGDECTVGDDDSFLKFKEKGGFTEDDVPCPINKYGITKLMGEEELLKLKDKNLKYYIIRTSKLFGPKGKSNEAKDSFFDLMLNISKDKKEVNVVSEELSCFTYTKDLAIQTLDILNNKEDFGIYHVRNSEPAIWYDAARELFRLKNIKTKINPVSSDLFPRPAKRPKYSVLANTKLPALRTWKDALEEYLKKYN